MTCGFGTIGTAPEAVGTGCEGLTPVSIIPRGVLPVNGSRQNNHRHHRAV